MNWVICVLCIVVGGVIGASIQISNSKPEIELRPNPDRFVAAPFTVGGSDVYEFRNSQGGTCVLVSKGIYHGDPIALHCMTQLPSIDYESLPPAQ